MASQSANSSPISAARMNSSKAQNMPRNRRWPMSHFLEPTSFAVDEAFYAVLRAQAVLQVAQETVKARQLVSDQITTLEKNKLKSGLDVSFANVDLSQAQLLQIQ